MRLRVSSILYMPFFLPLAVRVSREEREEEEMSHHDIRSRNQSLETSSTRRNKGKGGSARVGRTRMRFLGAAKKKGSSC